MATSPSAAATVNGLQEKEVTRAPKPVPVISGATAGSAVSLLAEKVAANAPKA
jgi:hypothetical protein